MAEKAAASKKADGGTAPEWPTEASSYELIGKIGQGAFAIVWKARRRVVLENNTEEDTAANDTSGTARDKNTDDESSVVCAVKILNLDHVDTNLAEIRLEVQAMRLLSHPNILTCHTAFANDRNLWLVTPLMRKGSSLHALQAARRALRKQQQLEGTSSGADAPKTVNFEQHIFYIMHETLLGLQYIHENGQIHRDCKGGNLLLDANGNVKIADFGVSGFLVQGGSQQEKAKTFVGTPCWMAPEVMEQVHGYDYKADLWSLGITALELAKGYAPYAKYPPMKVLILTIQEDPPSLASYDEEGGDFSDDDEVTDEYSKQFAAFVDMCLQKNPAKRPTCPELLASKHFAAFQDQAYRQERHDAIVDEICSIVKDVGYKQEEVKNNNSNDAAAAAAHPQPGHTPVSIVLSEAEDRPPGTTWIFADGSQVLSSSAKSAEVDDVMAELDEFGKQTGGEHYDRAADATIGRSNIAVVDGSGQNSNNNAAVATDDLDQFMDEFEMNTAGEDFRRDGSGAKP